MVYMVLPSPISSAKIALKPIEYKLISQLRPTIWCSLRVPFYKKEGWWFKKTTSSTSSTSSSSEEFYSMWAFDFDLFSTSFLVNKKFTKLSAIYTSYSIFSSFVALFIFLLTKLHKYFLLESVILCSLYFSKLKSFPIDSFSSSLKELFLL